MINKNINDFLEEVSVKMNISKKDLIRYITDNVELLDKLTNIDKHGE